LKHDFKQSNLKAYTSIGLYPASIYVPVLVFYHGNVTNYAARF